MLADNGICCFPEEDHQLLTDRGFLSLREVEAVMRLAADHGCPPLLVAGYDRHTQSLRYELPRRLVVNTHSETRALVELSQGSEAQRWATNTPFADRQQRPVGMSVLMTPKHDAWTRKQSETAWKKYKAGHLLAEKQAGSTNTYKVSVIGDPHGC